MVINLIRYKNVLEQLKDAGYSTYVIKTTCVIGQASMQAIRNNKPVNLSTIDTICQLTSKRIEEIVEILPDEKEDASE